MVSIPYTTGFEATFAGQRQQTMDQRADFSDFSN
jgi:hypothetical protein